MQQGRNAEEGSKRSLQDGQRALPGEAAAQQVSHQHQLLA
jgi:hypothetical protein